MEPIVFGSGLNFVAMDHFWLVAFDGISFDCLLSVVAAAAVDSVAVGVAAADVAAIVVDVIAVAAVVAHLVQQILLLVLRLRPQVLRYIHVLNLLFGRPVFVNEQKKINF